MSEYVTLKVSNDLYDFLEVLAKEKDWSLSQVVRDLMNAGLTSRGYRPYTMPRPGRPFIGANTKRKRAELAAEAEDR